MPELAEVEFYRKQWNAGRRQRVLAVAVHPHVRVFRTTNVRLLKSHLAGAVFRGTAISGKQILARFDEDIWLGLHLGMTGKLRLEPPGFKPSKHDHLVLFQKRQALVFSDPRQFGLVLFHKGTAPAWWTNRGPDLLGPQFTPTRLRTILQHHTRLPIKAALLLQRNFPGIGNWMADEILWQARIHPQAKAGDVKSPKLLWKTIRFVCRVALRTIGHSFGEPPKEWLFHQRWSARGVCPRHKKALRFATVGGRTTAWCPTCQRTTLPRRHGKS